MRLMVPLLVAGTLIVVVCVPASLTRVPVLMTAPVPPTELPPPQPEPAVFSASSVKVPALSRRAPPSRRTSPLLPSLVKPANRRLPLFASVVPAPETVSAAQPKPASSVPVAALASVTVPPP